MKKHLFILLAFLLVCPPVLRAQETAVTVSGIVKDPLGDPLVGVNIIVKDKPGFGAVTDMNGNYKMNVSPYSILLFTYIGFDKQEINVKTNTVINVIMKETANTALDEVVITATGIQKKATLTGAITSVDVNDLRSNSTASITNALAGNVAGVIAMQSSGEPGATSEFWIRGISTFGANNAALVLVDGFERDLNEISVEDIQSFSVLKDASATAIYGSRGANGVVLITTKRGDLGKVNIDVKLESTYNTRTRTPEFVDGYTYAQMLNEARITRNLEPAYTRNELEIINQKVDPDLYPNVDWQDVLLKDGAMTYKASMNLSGGSTSARYFVSTSYVDEQGMYKTDKAFSKEYNTNADAKRWTYRMNVDINVTKSTLLKVGLSGALKKYNTPGLADNIWSSLVGQNPISIPVMYSDGSVPVHSTFDSQEGDRMNPYVLATQTGYREKWENTIQTNVTLEQDLKFMTKGLKFIGRFGFDTENKNSINRIRKPEQFRAERHRKEDGTLIMNSIVKEQIMGQTSESQGRRLQNFEAELHYNRAFATYHDIGAMLKYTQREETQTVDTGTDMIKGISKRNQGLSGRFTYAYKYRYFVEANFGYTGSENFAHGHQFGFFPAISGGWNLAEESFIKGRLKWLDMFKIRYSYGKVGNDRLVKNGAVIRFPYLSSFGESTGSNLGDYGSGNSFKGMHYTQIASNNLTWEVAKKHDLGIDMAFLNNRLTATIDFYKDTRESIYLQRTHLSDMVGITSMPYANVGKMESIGLDGNFAYREKIGKVELTVRGNMTLTKNEVIAYDDEAAEYAYRMNEGFRYNQARGLIALGLFKDWEEIRNSPKQDLGEYMPGDIKYRDVNGDGVINDLDKVPIGATRVPNLIYGLGFSLKWHGFDVNAHFQGAGKSAYFLNGPTVFAFNKGEWGNVLTDLAEPGHRWIAREISGDPATENPNAKYPRLSYGGNSNNYRESTFWLRNGSYLRFKTLEVGYTLPRKVTNKLRMDKMRIYFLGNNLFVWDSLKLWDPELASGNGMKYPISRTYSLGLTVNF